MQHDQLLFSCKKNFKICMFIQNIVIMQDILDKTTYAVHIVYFETPWYFVCMYLL